jgi:hypothetical protein
VGWGADDGALRLPDAAPTDPEPDPEPALEPVAPDVPTAVELPPAGFWDTPFDAAGPLELTGAVECPGRAWLK